MRAVEVAVGPALEGGVVGHAVAVTDGLEVSVKGLGFCGNDVVRGQVYAAAKPPSAIVEGEIAHVHVDDGHMRIAGMEHAGHACGGKTLGRRPQLLGQCRIDIALHCREIQPALFDDTSFGEDARVPTPARGAIPGIAGEFHLIIKSLQRRNLRFLNAGKSGLNLLEKTCVHHLGATVSERPEEALWRLTSVH